MKTIVGLVLIGWLFAAGVVRADAVSEPPYLVPRIEAGTLPPLSQRLPETPRVIDLALTGKSPGEYGGTLRTLVGRPEDVRYLVVWGYARLVGYDASRDLGPDILERVEIVGDRVFTLHLRKGHRWSDGKPFTSEDFRYYWEDVLHDPVLTPGGLPMFLLADGQPPRFEVLDETTVRYAWDKPNRDFLPALAGARAEYLYQPAHYLRQFLPRNAATSAGQDTESLVATYKDMARQYRNTNPDLPSLEPWIHVASPDGGELSEVGGLVFERNPFFHRVDPAGRQLPYIDRIELRVVDPAEIPAHVAAGESDLQALGIGFEQFALLKLAEAQTDIVVDLWVTAKGSELALYPNFNVKDEEWRELLLTAGFRRALSLGLDREAINQLVFHGLGIEAADTVLRESPLYDPDFQEAWTTYDLDAANALLDGLGLTQRTEAGIRKLPDGRPMELTIAATAENSTELDVLNLVVEAWSALGIDVRIETMPRRELRERALAGDVMMSAWKGLENAVAGADWKPSELVPSQAVQLGWPAWGQYIETDGQYGEPIDHPDFARLIFLRKAWETAENRGERVAAWQSLLAWHAENVFSIGTVHAVPQPVVRRRSLQNVPENAVYNWEPGAYFGVYGPPTFWFDDAARRKD